MGLNIYKIGHIMGPRASLDALEKRKIIPEIEL
jgi:hypothetical protein